MSTTKVVKPFPWTVWERPDLEDKLFVLALLTSVLLHLVSFGIFILTPPARPQKNLQQIDVVYQTLPALPKEQPPRSEEIRSLQEKKTMPTPQILAKKEIGPNAFMQDIMKSPSHVKLHSKQPAKLNLTESKRHVSVPMLESEKIMNPRYLNYNERIREKIRNRAYFYVEHPDFEVGEVYLTFVLLSDGTLKEVKIMEDKSQANDYLRNIGLRSIKESAPFPAFPKDLPYPELTFNVVISFEVGSEGK